MNMHEPVVGVKSITDTLLLEWFVLIELPLTHGVADRP